ncbi:MAG: RidA family protein [Actinomycetota bacterium]|nr:RidA family protein [Actinomycetota bacterium]
MSLERVNPPSLAPARGFSHAVVADGRAVYLAGQTALDASGRVVEGDIVAQFKQALGNLLEALGAAGGRPGQLVSLTIYVVDVEGYKSRAREIGEVWRRLVGSDYPAMAALGVSRLWDVEALVEVQGVAVIAVSDGEVSEGS